MTIRYQADADLNALIVRAVQRPEPSIDFQTAAQAGLRGLHDLDVLERSASDGRILVTHDQRTMPVHFAEVAGTTSSPAVIIVPQYLSIGVAAEGLVRIWATSRPEEWRDRIFWLKL